MRFFNRRDLIITLLAACLTGAGLSAEPASEPVGAPKEVQLVVEPLKANYFDAPVEIWFKYTVTVPQPPGTAVVTLANADTGEEIVKTFPILLTHGEHRAYASWGGDVRDGEIERPEIGADLLDRKAGGKGAEKAPDEANAQDATGEDEPIESVIEEGNSGGERGGHGLPDGLYVPRVTLKSAKGAVLAEYRFSSDDVKHMVAGSTSRKVSRAAIDARIAEMKTWLAEITAMEAKARAAGADTSLPYLMLVALRETLRQVPERTGFKEYDLILANHAYVAQQIPLTQRQLEALLKDTKSGTPTATMPRPAGRMDRRDGYFCAGDKPVFMSGYCVFTPFLQQLPTIRDLGYNLIHAFTGSGSVCPSEGAFSGEMRLGDNPDPLAGYPVRKLLDQCAELGIKVDLGLGVNPPDWFFVRYPEARLKGASVAGMINYDIENPDALKWIESYLDAAMAQIAGHPALNCVWLANEPSYLNLGPHSQELFRYHVMGKYQTVEKLNEAWGTKHASFNDVKITWGGSSPAQIDFWWFNLGRLTKHFEWLAQLVRKHDPELPTAYKLNNLQMGWFCPSPNVDQEGVSDLTELIGMDSGALAFAKPYYDWLRSLSPEKPVVNLEFKAGGGTSSWSFWKGVLSLGLAGIDWWCWHPKATFSSAISYTAALHGGALATYHIQRLFPQVMAFHKFPRSPFVVLYPDPVLPRSRSYMAVEAPTAEALWWMGYAVDYATEKRVAAGRLGQYLYKIIVLPAADFIKDETFKRVEDFVRKGGVAVAIGDLPAHDPMGRPRELGWLKAPAEAKPAFADLPNSVVYDCGKGKIWMIPAGDPKTLMPRLDEIARQELPPQPVVIRNAENRTIPWKNAQGKDVFLTYLINEWHGGGYAVEPRFNVPMKSGVDLITGEAVTPEKIMLKPSDVRLIEWTPDAK